MLYFRRDQLIEIIGIGSPRSAATAYYTGCFQYLNEFKFIFWSHIFITLQEIRQTGRSSVRRPPTPWTDEVEYNLGGARVLGSTPSSGQICVCVSVYSAIKVAD